MPEKSSLIYTTPLPEFVQDFFDYMDEYPEEHGQDVWDLRKNVIEKAFAMERLDVRDDLVEKYQSLVDKYVDITLLPVQRCMIYLWLCVYTEDDRPRWPELLAFFGRGFGKTKLMATCSLMLTSPFNPAPEYDIDIVANSEEQALTTLDDLNKILSNPKHKTVLKKYWKALTGTVRGKTNGSSVKANTSNPKTKDGKRTACVMFDEVHGYQNPDQLNIFMTGLGKKHHSRIGYFTTDGKVIGGVLDTLKRKSDDILRGKKPDMGLLPFCFHLDTEQEVFDKTKWIKANPRIKYSPDLLWEIEREFEDYKENPDYNSDFSTRRMNLRRANREMAVTTYANLEATKKPVEIPDGTPCVIGIDYAKTSDWVGVVAHFKIGEMRHDIAHAFICAQGADYKKLQIDVGAWERKGWVTVVDAPDIRPEVVARYIQEIQEIYPVYAVAIDSYRHALMGSMLEELGFNTKDKSLKTTRPSDEIKISPKIESLFQNHLFCWGENQLLRWCTNNASLVPATKSKLTLSGELNSGNFRYGKQEPVRRKTDAFMALVAAVCVEDQLPDVSSGEEDFILDAISF